MGKQRTLSNITLNVAMLYGHYFNSKSWVLWCSGYDLVLSFFSSVFEPHTTHLFNAFSGASQLIHPGFNPGLLSQHSLFKQNS